MRVFESLFIEHNAWLVLVAALMCVIGAGVTMRLVRRAARATGPNRLGWQFLIAVCAGATIWTTHFIAMLGYQPGAAVTFDPILTIISLLLAMAGAGGGFAIVNAGGRGAPLFGGALVGLAIAAMHYTGMFAYQVNGPVTWSQPWVLASLALGVALSIACAVAGERWNGGARRHAATALFVLAILGLHFTAMAAFRVAPMPGAEMGADGAAIRAMALAIALVGLVLVGTGLSSYLIDHETRANSDEQLRQMALHDPLTGLPNRTNLNARLDRMLGAHRPEGPQIAVVVIDLDHFKEINDIWGHAAGDLALRAVADRLRNFTGTHDYVARFGGDEFCAVLTFEQDAELQAAVERLEDLLSRPLRLGDIEAAAGASIGVAVHPRDGSDRETLMRNADLAMYRAKTEDGANVCFYDTEMGEAVRERRLLVNDLRHAIANDELDVHYQVQTSVTSGGIRGYEALLRWRHPERGPISPAVFIPLAEANGLILPLGEWVLRHACRDAAHWAPGYKVAVNLSSVQLSHANLPELVRGILDEAGLAPERLELELTETAVARDKARSLRFIQEIKALGVSVALDDFGTGYSSLDTLRTFPFDKIKLDRSFVGDLGTDRRARAIIRAVLALARSLGIPVLAEGIETPQQLALLRSESCDEVQGFLLGRPVPVAQLAAQGGPLAGVGPAPAPAEPEIRLYG
jgi:diguanylate cyclase (GGDEF)-like protein